jgi:hypothetical protein
MSRRGLSAVIATSTTSVRDQIFNFDNSTDCSLMDLALRAPTCFETNQTTGDAPTEAPYVPLRNRYPVFLSVGFHHVSKLNQARWYSNRYQIHSRRFWTIIIHFK